MLYTTQFSLSYMCFTTNYRDNFHILSTDFLFTKDMQGLNINPNLLVIDIYKGIYMSMVI